MGSCLLILPAILAVPLPGPQVLFRDAALVHQSSHSHRTPLLTSPLSPSLFHTPVRTPSLLQSPSLVRSPSLVQHTDGRLFAVNANLQPGQLFQTADGRIFTLAAQATSAFSPTSQAPSDSSGAPSSPFLDPNQDDVIIAARDSPANEEAIKPIAEETTTVEPVTEAPVPRPAQVSLPLTSPVIATAPLTPSTARFVSAIPATFQLLY